MGLLKTGHKTLFLRDSSSAYCTRQPLCVLDFFVLPQHQRQGIGQAIFQVLWTSCLQLAATTCGAHHDHDHMTSILKLCLERGSKACSSAAVLTWVFTT